MNKKERLLNAIAQADAEDLRAYLIDMIRETMEEDDIIEGMSNGNVYEDDNTKVIEDYYINGLMIDVHAIMGEE